jgi:hypothetical protein
MWEEWIHNYNETPQAAVDLMDHTRKLDGFNERKICEMLPVNETVENSVISTCLSVAYIDLKN